VVSTFRPDVDMSRVYAKLIQKIESNPHHESPNGMSKEDFLNAVRSFANSAAFLLFFVAVFALSLGLATGRPNPASPSARSPPRRSRRGRRR
jgi:hypothetical protein